MRMKNNWVWLLGVLLLFSLVSCQKEPETFESQAPGWKATNPGGGGAFNSPVMTLEGYWVVGSDLGGVYISKNSGARVRYGVSLWS
jgi:hypothetical protein